MFWFRTYKDDMAVTLIPFGVYLFMVCYLSGSPHS